MTLVRRSLLFAFGVDGSHSSASGSWEGGSWPFVWGASSAFCTSEDHDVNDHQLYSMKVDLGVILEVDQFLIFNVRPRTNEGTRTMCSVCRLEDTNGGIWRKYQRSWSSWRRCGVSGWWLGCSWSWTSFQCWGFMCWGSLWGCIFVWVIGIETSSRDFWNDRRGGGRDVESGAEVDLCVFLWLWILDWIGSLFRTNRDKYRGSGRHRRKIRYWCSPLGGFKSRWRGMSPTLSRIAGCDIDCAMSFFFSWAAFDCKRMKVWFGIQDHVCRNTSMRYHPWWCI